MFEQPLYEPQQPAEPERVITPPGEGDFLYGYEIRSWDLGPRIYKILGIAAAANLLALLVVAQTSMLTMKGCDSPLVGGVCQVLDTVYVGAMLFGTERDMVDAEYDKTELGEEYDVTFVDMTGASPPISYPEGYFQIANRDELAALAALASDPSIITSTSGIPGIPDGLTMTPPSVNGGSMLDTKPSLPPANPDSVEGELPSGFGSTDPNAGGNLARPRLRPKIKRPVTPPPATNPDGLLPGIPGSGQVAEVKPSPSPSVEPTAPETAVSINKRPFIDLANAINELLASEQIKLDSQFVITGSGKLGPNGKLDKNFRFSPPQGDQNLGRLAQEAVSAVNDSNMLQYLDKLQGRQVTIQIKQDDQNVVAMIAADFENEMRPVSVATALSMFFEQTKKDKQSPTADQNDKDDLVLLQNATANPTGKRLEVLFTIPKQDFQNMIQRKLAEQRTAPKEPNSTSSARPQNNTASPE